MALNNDAVLVAGSGNYFIADVGTEIPDDLGNPGEAWVSIGHTSIEDILKISSEGGEPKVLGTLQSKALRTTYSPRSEAFAINLQQFDEASLKLYYGGNATVGTKGELQVPQSPTPTSKAFLSVFFDGERAMAFHAHLAEIYRGDDLEIADTEELASLPLKVSPMVYSTNKFAYSVTPIKKIKG